MERDEDSLSVRLVQLDWIDEDKIDQDGDQQSSQEHSPSDDGVNDLAELHGIVHANDVTALKYLVESGRYPTQVFTRLIFELVDSFPGVDSDNTGRLRSFLALLEHPNVPIDCTNDNGETIVHLILKSYAKPKGGDAETLMLRIITAICDKLPRTSDVQAEPGSGVSGTTNMTIPAILDRVSVLNWNILHWAVRYNHLSVVELLVSLDVDINIPVHGALTTYKHTILSCAISWHCFHIARFLILNGAHLRTAQNESPMESLGHHIVEWSQEQEVTELLHAMVIAATATNVINVNDVPLLFKYCDEDTIRSLLEKKTCIACDDGGDKERVCAMTILIEVLTTECNHVGVILEDMAQYGFLNEPIVPCSKLSFVREISCTDEVRKFTPLQTTLRRADSKVLQVLLQYDVDTNDKGDFTFPPICHIMQYNSNGLECLRILLRFGCDLNRGFLLEDRDRFKVPISILDYYILSSNMFMCRVLYSIMAPRHRMWGSDRRMFSEASTIQEHICEDFFTHGEVDDFIDDLCVIPSLYKLARNAVRKELYDNIECKIEMLDVPSRVKQFLNLDELDHLEEQYEEFKNTYLSGNV